MSRELTNQNFSGKALDLLNESGVEKTTRFFTVTPGLLKNKETKIYYFRNLIDSLEKIRQI
ncbi:hypothetical protein LEP1GSC151_1977 [Leptospira interrogans serovar Grippotyphosa str. LT2186]|uniref:Uncharacterized protein n=1 Tax=Leptospira interrogans serovar Grippotyphosa str. LT2186 TaxID=1001599 RepID=M3H0A2_LEPIR|nr:hypothetical protein LEP1GSC151_1977 [Leptospira interrogans serovar Grippotyphosa str. LT2186]